MILWFYGIYYSSDCTPYDLGKSSVQAVLFIVHAGPLKPQGLGDTKIFR